MSQLVTIVVFTDQEIFTAKCAHNRGIHHQLLRNGQKKSSTVEIVSCSQYPASVMLWASTRAVGKTPLVSFDRDGKISTVNYQEVIL